MVPDPISNLFTSHVQVYGNLQV